MATCLPLRIAENLRVSQPPILSEKTQYNPNPVPIYDPVKVEHKIKYHEKELELMFIRKHE
jgi:hypothetical protein